MEPGFGSFAHNAAKIVDRKATSEDEALFLAAVEGYMPRFVIRFSQNCFTSIKDTESGLILWSNDKTTSKTLNS